MSEPTKIHPSALVSPDAELGAGVEVGPYAVIEGAVRLGDRCVVGGHAQIVGDVEIGAECRIGRGAIVGEDPQDLGFDRSTASGVKIGRGNVLREMVTVHRSTVEGGHTEMGDGNYLMVGVHLAHDVRMGNGNILANNCLLAGHVQVGNRVFMGGGTVVHQFVRLGDYCLTQGNSGFSKDIPPFVIGHLVNRYGGLNVVGLKRAGFDPETRKEIRRVVDGLLRSKKTFREAVAEVTAQEWGEEAKKVIAFVTGESRKGVLVATGS